MPSNEFSAVFLILTGILLDTLEEIATEANFALQRQDYACHKIKAYRLFVGNDVDSLIEWILTEERRSYHHVRQSTRELAAEYERRADRLTTIYPRISELLTTLPRCKTKAFP